MLAIYITFVFSRPHRWWSSCT